MPAPQAPTWRQLHPGDDPAAEEMQLRLYREMPGWQKLGLFGALVRSAWELASSTRWNGTSEIRDADLDDVDDDAPDPLSVTLTATDILDSLGVGYFLCGSMASILYGLLRTTQDADLVADLKPRHVEPFVSALGDAFYVEPESVRRAVLRAGGPESPGVRFNVIHPATAFKVDVYLPGNRPFDRMQLQRRQRQVVRRNPERALYVATAEDTLLAKLDWYEQGRRVSERQWRDVLGIVKTQGAALDVGYLRLWGARLDVEELLESALAEEPLAVT